MLRLINQILALAVLAGLLACNQPSEVDVSYRLPLAVEVPAFDAESSLRGYDLEHASSSFALPEELIEISALTDIDDHTVACVQDEVGMVFFIDLRAGEVVRRQPFGPAGDYEGITRVHGSLWVIESGGLVVELVDQSDGLAVKRELKLNLGHDDIEGLGYDPVTNAILVAPKDKPKGEQADRNARRVFAIDAESGGPATVVLETSIDRIEADAEQAGIALPYKTTKQGEPKLDLKVRFSSIAVHPASNQILALSAVDAAILAFGRDGELLGAHCFDPASMPKLEGMTFLANGDLVIASEGVDGPARLHVFRYDPDAAR